DRSQSAAAGAAAAVIAANTAACAAHCGVACQRAVLDRQGALVEDRAPQAGGTAARAAQGSTRGAITTLRKAVAERQGPQGPPGRGTARESAEVRCCRRVARIVRRVRVPRDRDTLGQAGLAVDSQLFAEVEKKGGSAGLRRAHPPQAPRGAGQADGPAVDRG